MHNRLTTVQLWDLEAEGECLKTFRFENRIFSLAIAGGLLTAGTFSQIHIMNFSNRAIFEEIAEQFRREDPYAYPRLF